MLRFRGTSPLDSAPVASGSADIAFWLAYVVAIAMILFWSVRRKQV
jgi:hypothetical protein